VLERFDPGAKDWRAPEAAAANPRGKARSEDEDGPGQAAPMGARGERKWQRAEGWDEEAEDAAAEEEWTPWAEEKWDGKSGVPWEEDDFDFEDFEFDEDDDDDMDPFGGAVGVSLSD